MKVVWSLGLILVTMIDVANACDHLNAPVFEIVDEDDRVCAFAEFDTEWDAWDFYYTYYSKNKQFEPAGVEFAGFTPAIESAPSKTTKRTPKNQSAEGFVRVRGCLSRCWGVR